MSILQWSRQAFFQSWSTLDFLLLPCMELLLYYLCSQTWAVELDNLRPTLKDIEHGLNASM